MQDPRYDKLARVLVEHSTRIQPGERVLIEAFEIPDEMVVALMRTVREAGGIPLVSIKHQKVQRELIRAGLADLATHWPVMPT